MEQIAWKIKGAECLHFCIFTTYLRHIIQDRCSHNLNVSYWQRQMGKYMLLEVMDHFTLPVGTNFLFCCCCAKFSHYSMSNRPELEKAKQPTTVRAWIQHQLCCCALHRYCVLKFRQMAEILS